MAVPIEDIKTGAVLADYKGALRDALLHIEHLEAHFDAWTVSGSELKERIKVLLLEDE